MIESYCCDDSFSDCYNYYNNVLQCLVLTTVCSECLSRLFANDCFITTTVSRAALTQLHGSSGLHRISRLDAAPPPTCSCSPQHSADPVPVWIGPVWIGPVWIDRRMWTGQVSAENVRLSEQNDSLELKVCRARMHHVHMRARAHARGRVEGLLYQGELHTCTHARTHERSHARTHTRTHACTCIRRDARATVLLMPRSNVTTSRARCHLALPHHNYIGHKPSTPPLSPWYLPTNQPTPNGRAGHRFDKSWKARWARSDR